MARYQPCNNNNNNNNNTSRQPHSTGSKVPVVRFLDLAAFSVGGKRSGCRCLELVAVIIIIIIIMQNDLTCLK
jgi:hypothetical protein